MASQNLVPARITVTVKNGTTPIGSQSVSLFGMDGVNPLDVIIGTGITNANGVCYIYPGVHQGVAGSDSTTNIIKWYAQTIYNGKTYSSARGTSESLTINTVGFDIDKGEIATYHYSFNVIDQEYNAIEGVLAELYAREGSTYISIGTTDANGHIEGFWNASNGPITQLRLSKTNYTTSTISTPSLTGQTFTLNSNVINTVKISKVSFPVYNKRVTIIPKWLMNIENNQRQVPIRGAEARFYFDDGTFESTFTNTETGLATFLIPTYKRNANTLEMLVRHLGTEDKEWDRINLGSYGDVMGYGDGEWGYDEPEYDNPTIQSIDFDYWANNLDVAVNRDYLVPTTREVINYLTDTYKKAKVSYNEDEIVAGLTWYEPAIGATVKSSDNRLSVVTDENGYFESNASYGSNMLLTISLVGCKPVSYTFDRHSVQVFLADATSTLESWVSYEDVIAAYPCGYVGIVDDDILKLPTIAKVLGSDDVYHSTTAWSNVYANNWDNNKCPVAQCYAPYSLPANVMSKELYYPIFYKVVVENPTSSVIPFFLYSNTRSTDYYNLSSILAHLHIGDYMGDYDSHMSNLGITRNSSLTIYIPFLNHNNPLGKSIKCGYAKETDAIYTGYCDTFKVYNINNGTTYSATNATYQMTLQDNLYVNTTDSNYVSDAIEVASDLKRVASFTLITNCEEDTTQLQGHTAALVVDAGRIRLDNTVIYTYTFGGRALPAGTTISMYNNSTYSTLIESTTSNASGIFSFTVTSTTNASLTRYFRLEKTGYQSQDIAKSCSPNSTASFNITLEQMQSYTNLQIGLVELHSEFAENDDMHAIVQLLNDDTPSPISSAYGQGNVHISDMLVSTANITLPKTLAKIQALHPKLSIHFISPNDNFVNYYRYASIQIATGGTSTTSFYDNPLTSSGNISPNSTFWFGKEEASYGSELEYIFSGSALNNVLLQEGSSSQIVINVNFIR